MSLGYLETPLRLNRVVGNVSASVLPIYVANKYISITGRQFN